jgi:hypothetical protein
LGTSGWEGTRWLPDAGAVTFERSWRTRPRLRPLCHAISGCRQRKAKPPRYRGKVGAELSRGSQRDAAPCRLQSASLGGAAGAGSWLWLVSVRLLNAVKRAHVSAHTRERKKLFFKYYIYKTLVLIDVPTSIFPLHYLQQRFSLIFLFISFISSHY